MKNIKRCTQRGMRRRGNKNELLNRHLQLGRICNMVLEDDSIIAWRRYVGCVSHAQFVDTFQLLLTLRDMGGGKREIPASVKNACRLFSCLL